MSGARLSREHQGLLLGFLGVLIFSGSLPATRIAVQTLDPMFVGLGRSVVAAHLAAIALIVTRQPFPRGAAWLWLAIAAGVDCCKGHSAQVHRRRHSRQQGATAN